MQNINGNLVNANPQTMNYIINTNITIILSNLGAENI